MPETVPCPVDENLPPIYAAPDTTRTTIIPVVSASRRFTAHQLAQFFGLALAGFSLCKLVSRLDEYDCPVALVLVFLASLSVVLGTALTTTEQARLDFEHHAHHFQFALVSFLIANGLYLVGAIRILVDCMREALSTEEYEPYGANITYYARRMLPQATMILALSAAVYLVHRSYRNLKCGGGVGGAGSHRNVIAGGEKHQLFSYEKFATSNSLV